MEEAFNGSERIGDIVAGFPGAGNLMKEYRIDFCCGGNRTLSAALEQRQIDKKAFLERLNELYRQAQAKKTQATDWREKTSSELIDHIVQTHHAYLREELPLLSEFVAKIWRVHGEAHPELEMLHDRFHRMKEELEQHLVAEEEALFPLIRKAEQSGAQVAAAEAAKAIEEMEDDHSAVGDLLQEMREITRDYLLPEDACRTYTLAFRKLEELESDMFEHIHLENNVLFPRYKIASDAH
ncbi:MAG: iron-sulfur cluster repair di-iron protein [Thermobacillus sp.]|uniref:Iron-sulfur cluster repair di-iron protein n=1 Tax=Thermobacillus composti (strain DSM 18247 / JCM 13945 / KWC4) TaxID=717605 RepID=L0ECG8_THECK|nr:MULTISPECIES: iron-sulfur cluster repair di-iron protein [Thermobacillus]AGA57376.1 iron-sulfur cluster repair di-iron protein [Thermobacillus composti KWC4]REK52205.1 MAG: iron-sulfur cluster repair di-iron protein [Thermobacillus sp.]